jgi:hypothetical protein
VFASTAVATRPLHAIDPADEARFVWIRQHLQSLDFVIRTLSQGEKNEAVPLTSQSIKKINECKAEMEASADTYALQAAFDPKWESGVPYTILIAADGKVLYRREGDVDLLELRRTILANLHTPTTLVFSNTG